MSRSSQANLKRGQRGLTLVELLLFAAIFMFIAIVFIAILISVTRVYVRQSSSAEVNQQSTFLMQTIQRAIEQSSLIHDDMPVDTATSSLKLYAGAGPNELVRIYKDANGIMYLERSDTDNVNPLVTEPLTTESVKVSSIVFTRHTNPPGFDSVSVKFTMDYNTANLQQKFIQELVFGAARVSAAQFDSGIYPAADPLEFGAASQRWSPINGIIFFSGGNVGIGVSAPAQRLEVDGGFKVSAGAAPAFVVTESGGNTRVGIGIVSPSAMLTVSGGDVYVDTAGRGLIVKNSGGDCYRITVDGAGTLAPSAVACP